MKLTKGRILEFGFVLFMAIILITSIIEESWFDASVAGAGIISGLIPFFIEKTFKTELDGKMKVAYILFLFASQYLGSIVGLYGNGWWDTFLHLLSGIFLAFLGFDFFSRLDDDIRTEIPKRFLFVYIVVFSMAGAALWEMYEFTSDVVLNTTMQGNGNDDTMVDIIAGSLGGILAAFFVVTLHQREKSKQKRHMKKSS
ncbi:hypothetical protein ACFO4U_00560 [Exiguobacterium profundum]|uniref:hypothetical protein n=1 Tax=Exiguobacterium TaxID=33986 RepID=UPI000939B8F3|nr:MULTISPECIES: hypothetical protein [Exiguobacterium]QPI66986.1 hypothetical protein IR194_10995 [Exiguobacterium sp. PBE]MBG0918351.1 hypothetical protein [Exiguobacterium sp. SRB7LM]MCT4799426.1 hypothetical protein [Exiguobacterium profundum]MDT0190910.1 hypothetical protein [Exiguobacterium sp. BG5(2022)]VXA92892.1 conserved membrane hypothetical protein [Exiguobacterium sp. 8H]